VRLLVVKGADFDLRGFLPEADHGSIIIITRSSQVKLGHRIRLEEPKDINDSLEILSYTSGRKTVPDGEPYPQVLTSH
jgi:hypothetical protein